MAWDTVPGRVVTARDGAANYRLWAAPLPPSEDSDAALTAALVKPFTAFFAYRSGAGGCAAALTESLLRLETCSAPLDAAIPAMWQDLARTGLTVAEDTNKQCMDRLFGLDGKAGLLGSLKRYRRVAADELTAMSSVQQAEFLDALFAFADPLRDEIESAASVWPARGAVLALALYLQALGLISLVQDWIGGLPGAREQAAMARHRAYLAGDREAWAGEAAGALHAAAQALEGS